jgi:hypothetical protein
MRVFEDRVLSRIFGPRGNEVSRDWRKLQNEEFHNLYSSPNIVKIVKSWRIKWAGHVACMEKSEMRTKFRLESLKERGHSEDLGKDKRIILKWMIAK